MLPHPGQPVGTVGGRWSAWRSVSWEEAVGSFLASLGLPPRRQLEFEGFLGSRQASTGWGGRWRGVH